MDVAESYRNADRRTEANAAFGQAWARLEAMGRGETEKAGTLLNNWALVVRTLGDPTTAERLFRKAMDVTSAGQPGQGVSPMLLNNYGRTLLDLGRDGEALEYTERAYRDAKTSGSEVVITQSLFLRALVHFQRREGDRAAAVLAELGPRVSRLPEGHGARPVFESLTALLAEARGDAAAAAAAHDRAVARSEGQDTHGLLLVRRSAFHLGSARLEEARSDAARALAVESSAVPHGTLSSRVGIAGLALARALDAQGQVAEARAAAVAALRHLEPSVGADHPDSHAARALAGGSPAAP
jgi:tetratricopeptide (TPR) repeat protein